MHRSRWCTSLGGGGQLLAVTAIALVSSGCDREAPRLIRADCPSHQVMVDTGYGGSITDIPVASEIDDIPEFHDCQRFIVKTRYGDLFAIWAAYKLDSLFVDGPAVDPSHRESVLKNPYGASAATIAAAGLAIAVGEIYNFGRETYDPLKIKPGFNCLYLSPDLTDVKRPKWKAWIVSLGYSAGPCRGAANLREVANQGHELRAAADAVPQGFTPDDIAPVARWDREEGNRAYYIGLRCGGQWCEIGSAGGFARSNEVAKAADAGAIMTLFDSRPILGVTSPIRPRRVTQFKGWYDEQTLALYDPVKNLTYPSGVTGTIIPHPSLDAIKNNVAAFDSTWIPTAVVKVDGDYDGKLKFKMGHNELLVCHGTAQACGLTAPAPTCPTANAGADQWWMRIVQPDGSQRDYCVARKSSGTEIPAGAARWRWLENDETTWVRCAYGCCTGVP